MPLILRTLHKSIPLSWKACTSSWTRQYTSLKTSDPLRILFCGSDDFSVASLRAVHQEHLKDPELISSLDVVCKPGKPVGRGLKNIREVPIKAVAEQLSLPVHQINTFTNWELPRPKHEPINLIIAVSFGLFVPPRILSAAKYGGLNVHPSLLPDLRGSAPLHHALIQGRDRIGITLQTLHPKLFDHGTILAQTPYPGELIPLSEDEYGVKELIDFIAPKGADMLVQGLRDRVFVPPLADVGWSFKHPEVLKDIRPAHKITPEDRHIDWSSWDAKSILRRNRVIGPLWSILDNGGVPKRIKFKRMSLFRNTDESPEDPGTLFQGGSVSRLGCDLCVWTVDGKALRLEEITIEGKPPVPGNTLLRLVKPGKPFRCI